jgi:hypothetical protein
MNTYTTIIMCHTLYIYRRKLQNLDVPKCWSHETSFFFLPKTFIPTVVKVQLCFSAVENMYIFFLFAKMTNAQNIYTFVDVKDKLEIDH